MQSDPGFEIQLISGSCRDAYTYLGNHRDSVSAGSGVLFRVYAPAAKSVRVAGEFNSWGAVSYPGDEMQKSEYGFFSTLLSGIPEGSMYKYEITDAVGNVRYKSDPFAISSELRPGTASIVCGLPAFAWSDSGWLSDRANGDVRRKPVNIYEVHLGSWKRGRIPGIDYEKNWQEAEKRKADEPFLNYREIADLLSDYLAEMHYTHVELMPLCEHPLDGSWGYQTGSYYSLTSRFGSPEDFMYFVDRLHSSGIGVIMDWVPGHFCKDESWLSSFDGSYLFEYEQENKRENPLWGTANFDYSKPFVKNFMISNAIYWLKEYHIDGLRVDAVANIIYFDYNHMHKIRPKNASGGEENTEAVMFLRDMNYAVHEYLPGVITVAEDSSTYPGITADVKYGGMGFDFKWDMGWMNDTLEYMSRPSALRSDLHNKLTFAMMYAHTERFMLSLSHDEAVHGKKTMLDKMYGPLKDKFVQFRTFMVFFMCHPGKKLLFMGSEFGQIMEWRYYESLEWKMLLYPPHGLLKEYVKALNLLYLSERSLYAGDYRSGGFSWIDADDSRRCVYSFFRCDPENDRDFLVVACNFSDRRYREYELGVPRFCDYEIAFRSGDDDLIVDETPVKFRPVPKGVKDMPFCVKTDLPAYGAIILKPHFSY